MAERLHGQCLLWRIVSLLSMKRGCARRSVSRQFLHFFPKGLENLMSVVELHAEVLFLPLRIDDAPTLSRDGSVDGLAGGGGFELRAIITTLLPLWGALILDGLLRRFRCLRGRRCANRSGATRCAAVYRGMAATAAHPV